MNETTVTAPLAVRLLATLLALAGLALVVVFAGPYVADFIVSTWASLTDAAAQVAAFVHDLFV